MSKSKPSTKTTGTVDRRKLSTRRLHALRRVTPGEALEKATNSTEVLHALKRKAEEFVDAFFLELGLKAVPGTSRAVQLALFQDFIEVHNAALARIVRLPEERDKVDKLMA